MALDSGGETGAAPVLPGPPRFDLQERGADAHRTLVLRGELDMAWASVLDAALRRLCTAEADRVVVDLSELTFMDSTGLRSVLLGRDLCDEHNCDFMLIPGPPQVQRLFEVTGLLEQLPFAPE